MIDKNRPVEPVEQSQTEYSFSAIGEELRAGVAYEKVGKNSRSLVRGDNLGMVLIAFKKGSELKDHDAPSPGVAVVLEGKVEFTSALGDKTMEPHDGIVFSADLIHGVVALEDSLLLLVLGGRVSA